MCVYLHQNNFPSFYNNFSYDISSIIDKSTIYGKVLLELLELNSSLSEMRVKGRLVYKI